MNLTKNETYITTKHGRFKLQQFLCDVAGVFRLWIGLSIPSLLELVSLVLELCNGERRHYITYKGRSGVFHDGIGQIRTPLT